MSAGFERLGLRARYRCLLGPMPGLGERTLGYLTEIDITITRRCSHLMP